MIKYIHPTSVEGLKNLPTNFIFPSHFLGLIVGKPGTGKTSLLKFMLQSDDLFFKKFNRILIVSPSTIEYSDLFLHPSDLHPELNLEWIEEKLGELKNTKNYCNVLLILDDVVADLKTESTNKRLLSLIFNRRHKLNNGMVSIIVTSQKYKTLPTAMRVAASFIVTFPISPSEISTIQDELVYSNINLEKIASRVFTNDKTFIVLNITNNKIYHEFGEINN